MNIRKEVHQRIIKKLEREQCSLKLKISKGKYEMGHIVDEQTKNKRELAELQKLIKSLGE